MLTEPADLDRTALADLLESRWGLGGARLEYLPLGFGSHHWDAVDQRGGRWFVTVDDLEADRQAGPNADGSFAALERAFRTAAALRGEARLEFVLAPLADDGGRVVHRLDARYAVTVSPFLEGTTAEWGPWESAEDRRRMGSLLGRLHAATGTIPVELPRRDGLAVQARIALEDALVDRGRT